MSKPLILAITVAVASCPVQITAADTVSVQNSVVAIPAGTEIPLVMGETISSKTHVKGDLFHLTTTKDLEIDGIIAIPNDTKVIAELTRAERKGAFGKSGKLEARLLYAELGNHTVRLRGSIGARGKGGTTETVLAAIAIGTLAFVVTGKSAKIDAGTELSGYLTSKATVRP